MLQMTELTVKYPTENRSFLLGTEIICQSFADRHVVVLSQIGCLGTLIEACAEDTSETSRKVYRLQTLIGRRDDPLLLLYARQIIERLAAVSDKPLLLAISLRTDDEARAPETFQALLNRVFDIATWTAT